MKICGHLKDIIKKVKLQLTEWEKYFANHISKKGSIQYTEITRTTQILRGNDSVKK